VYSNYSEVSITGCRHEQIRILEWNAHGEGTALAFDAVDPCISAVSLCNAFDDEQPKPRPFNLLVFLPCQPHVSLKKLLLMVGADAKSGIADADMHLIVDAVNADIDLSAVRGVLDGVVYQIGDGAVEHVGIGADDRHVIGDVDGNTQFLLFRRNQMILHNANDDLTHITGGTLHLVESGFGVETSRILNIVHQRGDLRDSGEDFLDKLRLLFVEFAHQAQFEHTGEALHGSQR